MPSINTKPFTPETVWEKVVPMIKNQSEKLVQLAFCRYKMTHQLIKRQIVEHLGDLDKHPMLSNNALQTNYAHVAQREQALTKTFKTDLATLKDLKQDCIGQPRCTLIVDEAKKSVREIQSYMTYHHPTLKEIQQNMANLGEEPKQTLAQTASESATKI